MTTLKPWREVAIPHDDVLRGTFQQAEFAADLSAVQQNKASEEYQDARKFFERTFITEGMRLLLENVVKRLTGKGGDPVIQLQTSFGGGKTHTMLAVYHLASRSFPASELRGVEPILDNAGGSDLPQARVVILDGTALGPNEVRQRGEVEVHTLWGELAWQLGGSEAYDLLKASDEAGTSPGKEVLVKLLQQFSPAVILVDELVAYVRQLSHENSGAGSYDSNLSFIQALTEAVKQVPTCCVLASLPESELEAGGERGQRALEALSNVFGRVQALWKPVSSEEAFEIVRRRLFKNDIDETVVKATCNAFYEVYAADPSYPNETREAQYRERMERAYPVHPELFDRLYQDWSSLEKFQRTRGVLKLMAKVIHRLWQDGISDYLITPGSLPLYDTEIRTELINYLPNGWEQIIESELDGERSEAFTLDGSNHFGAIQAARRVARALFLDTAPSVSSKANRGVEKGTLLLGVVQPGQQTGWFNDALTQLNDRLHFLNHAGDRYYLDTRANLRRTMEDRRKSVSADDVSAYIRASLQRQINVTMFVGIHVFTSHHDVPDDASLRLVVLPDKASYFAESSDSDAGRTAASAYLKHRGEQPRLNANRLIFMAADQDAAGNMRNQVKTALAWKSVVSDANEARLNLDQFQLKLARQSLEGSDEAARHTILDAYRWLLVPVQSASAGNVGKLDLEPRQLSSSQSTSAEIERVLKEHEDVITRWAPIHLSNILKTWYWKDKAHVSAKSVWEDFCKYPYLPRLSNISVFEQTLSQATLTNEAFGIAYGYQDGRFVDPHLGDGYNAALDGSVLLVEPSALTKQLSKDASTSPIVTDGGEAHPSTPEGDDDETPPTGAKRPRRFIGRVQFENSASAPIKFKEVYDEVISQLSKDVSTRVTISIDIEAHSQAGFDEGTQRAVRENSKTLELLESDFEDASSI